MSNYFRHYVPQEKRVEGFPFSFDVTEVEGLEPHTTINFEMGGKTTLMEELQIALQSVFQFYKYLDEDSLYYLPIITKEEDKPQYFIEVNVVKEVEETIVKTSQGVKKSVKQKSKHIVNTIQVKCHNFKSDYSYTLIKSVDHLKGVLEGAKLLSYDVETSGLDPEFDVIAGVNFSTDKNINAGYYMPLNHKGEGKEHNLPVEAFEVFYEAMVKAQEVFMYNARFDMRFAEFLDCDYNETSHSIENIKYDMSEVNFTDTYLTCYFADPGWNIRNMAFHEKHFLGFYRNDLKQVLRLHGRDDFDTTNLHPHNLLFYAAQDGITTLQLGLKTKKYLDEFGLSGQIDTAITFPLMRMENRLIKIDTEYVEKELKAINERLEELETLITDSIGREINLNSSQQKVKLFESFGLDTGKKTKSGTMSVRREYVDDMIERLENAGEDYPIFLKYLGEQSKLQQLSSGFFGSMQKQMYHRDGRVRLNYRHGSTATGRFSSGKEEF